MTALYGLLGRTLSHSYSPQIHDAIFKRLGIESAYSLYPMEPESVPGFIKSLASGENPCGINVTIPYKQLVMPYLDDISAEAAAIGAVNTIVRRKGRIMGYNTDYFGFRASLVRQGADVSDKTALVLGSGGSARTAVAVLKDMGAAKIHLASRNPQDQRFDGADVIGYEQVGDLGELALLVNTTPAGMHGFLDTTAIPGDRVPFAEFTFDLVYNPAETLLLRIAGALGSNTQNGLYMLVAQAAKAQEIWQGIQVPGTIIDVVYDEIRKSMANA